MSTPFTLPGIPAALGWTCPPLDWRNEPADRLVITAGPATDWFFDPMGTVAMDNAPSALFTPAGEQFNLSARIQVAFGATYDAGALHIRVSADRWGKLAFEYSPQQQPMIVSVVTRGVSDDCNSTPIAGNEVYLRLMRNGPTFAFHYSLDARFWHLVRYFSLGPLDQVQIGFSAQSPTGPGCTAAFSEIKYGPWVPPVIRSGQ